MPTTQPNQAKRSNRTGVGLILALSVVAALSWLAYTLTHKNEDTPKDPAVLQVWHSSESPALMLPATLSVTYVEAGDKVRLTIVSSGNPVVYVDVNANHRVDKGDVSYAAGLGNSVCIQKLDQPGNSDCSPGMSAATVKVQHGQGPQRTVWVLPKKEIAQDRDFADIVIQLFHADTQQGDYYPSFAPFQKVYRLRFDTASPSYEAATSSRSGTSVEPADHLSNADSLSTPQASAVGALPTILSFTSKAMLSGTQLSWKVQDAQTVTITPGIGSVPLEGTRQIDTSAGNQFVLTAHSAVGNARQTLTVAEVAAPPQISSFTADAMSVTAGTHVHLSWSVEGPVSSVRLEPAGVEVPSQGMHEMVLEHDTNVVLTATGPGGTASQRLTLAVKPPSSPVILFEVTPSQIHAGENAVLHWSVSDADHMSIDPGIGEVAANGSRTIRPAADTHYTLSATGAGGSQSRGVNISVLRSQGPARGRITWTGEVHGTQLVTIDHDHADSGTLIGTLPGEPCILQLANDKNISIASAPGPRNQYKRLVLRIKGNGPISVIIDWVLQ